MNYASLQTTTLSYLIRSGDSEAVAMCPTWIALAEDEIRMAMSRLMVPASESVDDDFDVDAEYLDFPSGLIKIRSFVLNDPRISLSYVAPTAIDRDTYNNEVGTPKLYTVQGGKIRVIPSPDADYTATITYYSLPSLSGSLTTNWLLTAYPKIYLWATLAEAYSFYLDEPNKNAKLSDLSRMISELEATQSMGNVASSLRIRLDGSCP